MSHGGDGGVDAPEAVTLLLAQVAAGLLAQEVGEAAHVPERRSQVVRDRVAERLELLVGGLQLGGPLLHPAVERDVELSQLGLCEHPVGDVGGEAEIAVAGQLHGGDRPPARFSGLGGEGDFAGGVPAREQSFEVPPAYLT